ncbi:hypothetical protein NM208_g604 [Fusarium decemcellulare]|uniref:Uncharacterized protein n=1 Tax=Fusarium decemcellulare TaxID=57161 RepID=A0ACC1SYZ8_9HYPO|nr:hypothetical protein NM208_g604 [Fusarium decemcellulare]
MLPLLMPLAPETGTAEGVEPGMAWHATMGCCFVIASLWGPNHGQRLSHFPSVALLLDARLFFLLRDAVVRSGPGYSISRHNDNRWLENRAPVGPSLPPWSVSTVARRLGAGIMGDCEGIRVDLTRYFT